MTSDDLDELAALWRDDPGPEEQKALEAIASSTSRRARLAGHVEIAVGVLLLIALVAAVAISRAPAALLVGFVLASAVIWSSWKRHRLAQIAELVDTSSRETLIDSAIRSTQARLARSRLGLLLLLPGYLIGTLTKYSVVRGNLDGFIATLQRAINPASLSGSLTIILLGGALAYFYRAHIRIRRELDHLEILRQEYRVEADHGGETSV